MMVATPWGPGLMSRISTMRLSPGSAPRTETGPVAGFTFEKSMSVTRSLSVWICPEKQSWVSKVTTSPGSTSKMGFISGPKPKTASSLGMMWSTLSMDCVMPVSFLAACRGRARLRGYGLILDEDLLSLGDGLRTLGGGEAQRQEAQQYPCDGEVVAQTHRVVRQRGKLVVKRGQEDQDGERREHAVQHHVELVSTLTQIEDDGAHADRHVDQDHHDGDRRSYDAESTDGLEGGSEQEGDYQGEYRLRYDRHVRRTVLRVGAPKHARQHMDAAHSVHHTGCGIDACVGIGYSAVGDGEKDDHPPDPPVVRRHGGPRVGILGVGAHPGEPPAHHGGVRAHEVKQPDHQRRGEDYPGNRPSGIPRLLPQGGRCLK